MDPSSRQQNSAEREKLELEMRNYQNNLIKESIRMAHRDLGDHFAQSGEWSEALKSYTKIRDYCSTTDHVIEMCLNVIEVSLRLENWTNVQTFVSKAEACSNLRAVIGSWPAQAQLAQYHEHRSSYQRRLDARGRCDSAHSSVPVAARRHPHHRLGLAATRVVRARLKSLLASSSLKRVQSCVRPTQ